MTTYFLSDPHLGHRKVAALRGFGTDDFPDTDLHDAVFMDNYRRVVGVNDVVWFLGDLSAGGAKGTRHALSLISQLPGRKRLIAGNHDPIHPMHRDAFRWSAEYAEVFEFVAPFARTRVQGVEVMLSHFPYEHDRHEARYLQYRLRDEGLPLLHGHTHVEERLNVEVWPTHTRVEVHVGLDARNLAPVSDLTIREELASCLSV